MSKKIKFEIIKDFKDPSIEKFLNWWASKTHHEHMLCRTPAFFRNNLLCAVKVTSGRKFVSGAGVISALDYNGKHMKFEGSPVVEFCSNYVDPAYGGKDIGKTSILYRMEESEKNNLLPVMVTKHKRIIEIITELGWEEMHWFRKYDSIREGLRDCACERRNGASTPFVGSRCEVCPLLGKSIWIKQKH